MKRRKFIQNTALTTSALLIPRSRMFASFAPVAAPAVIQPDWTGKTGILKHSWQGLGNIDQMRWIIRKDVQDQLALCHKEIGLRHVRAVGIFDDELRSYSPDPSNFFKADRNTKRVNWRIPFYIYDSLMDMGISPVVTTTFTPTGMASGTQTTFETKSNSTPPKDLKQWGKHVKDFTAALTDRYGLKVVQNWYFEAWNEPNLPNFWSGNQQDYFDLYRTTHDAIKSVDPGLRLGGPSTARAEWISDFLEFGDKNNCTPDYIIGHCYNNDSAKAPLSPFDGPQGDKENKSPNFTNGVVRGVKKILSKANYKGEIHWNEWGASWHPYSPVRETANEAAFIIKTMNAVADQGDYFAYWCLSDIYDQVGYGREAFHANFGMLSLDRLRKPSYHAHQMLERLGTEKVEVEGLNINEQFNAFVSKTKKGVQAIVYAFDIAYKADDKPIMRKVEFYLPSSINTGSIVITRIDSHENNIITSWKNMGSPAYLKPAEKQFLQNQNQLKASKEKIKMEKDSKGYKLILSMETPGVIYLEARYIV